MSGAEAFELGRMLVAAFAGAWFAVKVEIRYLRRDVKKLEEKADDHSIRIRALEIGEL